MKTLNLIIPLFIGVLLFGCGKDTPAPNPDPVVLPERVVMYRNDTSMAIGSSAFLLARVFPENASDRSVLWSSSDPSVVSINETGRIEAESEGIATIKAAAKAGSASTSFKVTVESDIKRVRGFLTYDHLSDNSMRVVFNIENTSNALITMTDMELYHNMQLFEDYPPGTFKQQVPSQSTLYGIHYFSIHSSWMSGLNAKVFFRMNDLNYVMTVDKESFRTELEN